MIKLTASTHLPTEYGTFTFHVFEDTNTGIEHVALSVGVLNSEQQILVRVHSQCQTSEIFHSLKCDCKWQLHKAMQIIQENGSGLIIYLQEEGRGIGLTNKIRAYRLQEDGLDTVEANTALGLEIDYRDYTVAAAILNDFKIGKIELLTNNPEKIEKLTKLGIKIISRKALETSPNLHNHHYFATKREKLGHFLSSAHTIN